MAKDYKKLAKSILEKVGGEENVKSLRHCVTRLRFQLHDESKVDMAGLKQVEGVIQVVVAAQQYQVVIGTDVGDVFEEIGKMTNISLLGDEQSPEAGKKKKNILNTAIDLVSGIFLPIMGAFMSAGLLKGILIILVSAGVLSADSSTYTLLTAIADGIFQFLPILLAFTAAKKFGANVFVAAGVAAALVYPTLADMYWAGTALSFCGIPVKLIFYPYSVIPIVVAVWVQSLLERGLKRVIPQILRGIFVPLISLVATSLLTFLVIGPVTNAVAQLMANVVLFLLGACPAVAGLVFGAVFPVMLIFGLHWGIVPVEMNNFSTLGYDPIMIITLATNFALAGCAIGVFLKTKNKELKDTAFTTGISALVAGVTEPVIYGVALKYKRPFIIACVLDAIGGMILAMAGAVRTSAISTSVLTIPALVAMNGWVVVLVAALGFFGAIILTYLFGFHDSMIEQSHEK